MGIGIIIYQDDTLLVVDKPAGVATLKAAGSGAYSLEENILLSNPELKALPDSGIAHRLDNDTSGIVCIGRTLEAYEALRRQFAEETVGKRYTALVVGTVLESGAIDAPIAHHPRKQKKMIVCESAEKAEELGGRPAHTSYVIVEHHRLGDAEYTLLDVAITTGVRHQIRAHLAMIGYPVAGDRLYQNPKKRGADLLNLKRNFLHAHGLEIDHPSTHERMTFKAPLPDDLSEALGRS